MLIRFLSLVLITTIIVQTPAQATPSLDAQALVSDHEIASAIRLLRHYYELDGECPPSRETLCKVSHFGEAVMIGSAMAGGVTTILVVTLQKDVETLGAAAARLMIPTIGGFMAGVGVAAGAAAYVAFHPSEIGEVPYTQSILASPTNFKHFLEMPASLILRDAKRYPELCRELILRAETAALALGEQYSHLPRR